MKRLAARAARASNRVAWVAIPRAALKAWPGATSWLTSPAAAALPALMLLPVNSRSRTRALPRSRLSRGIPPNPGISPSLNSGKQNRAVRSATIISQVRANSNPPPKTTP